MLKEGPVVFCTELFLSHKSQSMREFLESAVHLQCFKEVTANISSYTTGKSFFISCNVNSEGCFACITISSFRQVEGGGGPKYTFNFSICIRRFKVKYIYLKAFSQNETEETGVLLVTKTKTMNKISSFLILV